MHRFSRMHLSPEAALRSLCTIDLEEKSRVAEGVALIAVIDRRRDYLGTGHPSMCDYCVHRLHMSEDKALRRIQVARAALKFPELFECLADGRLSVTTACVLAPHLEPATAAGLIEAAAHRSRQEIQRLLATAAQPSMRGEELALSDDVQDRSESPAPVRVDLHVESSSAADTELAPPPEVVVPASAERRGRIVSRPDGGHEVRVALTEAELGTFRRVQGLLGHAVPSGDPAIVYARAMEHYVAYLEKQRLGTKRARAAEAARERIPRGRGIPKALRRAVWERDGGRCTFTGEGGHRWTATSRIEFDHIEPLGMGGSTDLGNLRLLCRAHNQYEAIRAFGKDHVNDRRELAQRQRARDRAAANAAKTRQTRERVGERSAAPSGRDPAAQALHDDLQGALRGLGFSKNEALHGAALADDLPGASLEHCLRVALRELTKQVQLRGERLARCSA